jgi:hypothetical protein
MYLVDRGEGSDVRFTDVSGSRIHRSEQNFMPSFSMMGRVVRVVSVLAVWGVFGAEVGGVEVSSPPHPTVLLVESGESRLPVWNVAGASPIVDRDGKKTKLRSDAVFFAERAPHYADGDVKIAKVTVNGMSLVATVDSMADISRAGGKLGGTAYFEFTANASVDLKGAFVAVLIYDKRFLTDDRVNPVPEIVVRELPTLLAGEDTKIGFSSPLTDPKARPGVLLLVFAAGGGEVQTNFSAYAGRYFQRIAQARLAAALPKYLAEPGPLDRAAVPALRFNPILPENVIKPKAPIEVMLAVSEKGWVTEVELPEEIDPRLATSLTANLQGWMFLPRIVAGSPVSTRIKLPLKF